MLQVLWLSVAAIGCSGPTLTETGGDDSGSYDVPGTYSLLVDVTILDEPADVQVLLLPEDSGFAEEAAVAWGRSGERFDAPVGTWTVYAGESYEPSGLQGGMPFHVAEDGSSWIGAPVAVSGAKDDEVFAELTLNLLVTGWWTCCDGFGICSSNQVSYEGGEWADLPGLISVRVSGMEFAASESDVSVIGAFEDPHRATARWTQGTEVASDWTCCDQDGCDDP